MIRERVEEVAGVRLLDNIQAVPSEVSRLRKYGLDTGFDLETTDKDPLNSRIVTVALKPRGKKATVIDVRHWSQEELCLLGSMLEPLFDGSVTLVGQNLKFDFEFFLAKLRIGAHRAYDVMLAEQVILGLGMSSASEKNIHFDLASIGERYGVPVHKEERSWFIHLDERDEWNQPFPIEQLAYIRQDVSVVHVIKEKQAARIKEWGLGEVVELEMRTLLPLTGVEVWGVSIERDGWLEVIDRVSARAKELEAIIHMGVPGEYDGLDIHVLRVRNEKYHERMKPYNEWWSAREAFVETRRKEWDEGPGKSKITYTTPEGTFKNWSEYKKAMLEWWHERNGKQTRPPGIKDGVNLGSWMQVRDGFNDLGIPVTSVSEETLEPYRTQHPLVGVYLDYIKHRKIVTVYGRERGKKGKAFIELLDEHNRLRASYQQIGADTGRMSSFSPNFQQIPVDGLGAELRKHVIPAAGYTFVVADFSNIELRIVAELSGDKFLLDAFASGQDVHAYTAKVMFKLTDEQATKKWTDTHDAVVGGRTLPNTSYRKIAKTINYMLLYGAGVKKLAAMLGLTERDARTLLNLYYTTFAQAITWLNTQKGRLDQARKAGEQRVFALTRSGRRRWFDIPTFPVHPANGQRVSVEAIEKWEADVDSYKQQNASIKRQLANTPIQGLSADITKEAAALWYERAGYDEYMKLVAIIHDEFILETLPATVGRASQLLEEVMMQAMRKYLHVVDLGEVHPVVTPYWMH